MTYIAFPFNDTDESGGASADSVITFESIAGNHNAYPSTVTFDAGGAVTGKSFDTGSGTINVAYAYDAGGALTGKTLSGDLPAGIATTKNYTYDNGGNLTGTSYA